MGAVATFFLVAECHPLPCHGHRLISDNKRRIANQTVLLLHFDPSNDGRKSDDDDDDNAAMAAAAAAAALFSRVAYDDARLLADVECRPLPPPLPLGCSFLPSFFPRQKYSSPSI